MFRDTVQAVAPVARGSCPRVEAACRAVPPSGTAVPRRRGRRVSRQRLIKQVRGNGHCSATMLRFAEHSIKNETNRSLISHE
jgi:hypothetical protein